MLCMKISFLFVALFFGFSEKASSQLKGSSRATQIQLELFGPASLFSVAVDSRFGQNEDGLGFRIGLGGSPLGTFGKSCNTGGIMALPAGINYLIGKKQHFAELGGGVTLVVIGSTKVYCTDFNHGFFSDNTESYLFLTAGYRFQPYKNNGFTYRVFVSPLFQKNFPVKQWGGVSVGYKF